MKSRIDIFTERLASTGKNAVGLFYFARHGIGVHLGSKFDTHREGLRLLIDRDAKKD